MQKIKNLGSVLLFFFILFGLYSAYANAQREVAPRTYMLPEITHVVDGDTIGVILGPLKHYPPLNKVKIRILNIDTPEHDWRAACIEERNLGIKAKEAVKQLIGDKKRIKITNYKWDKYGGRIDANVSVGGIDIAEYLIEKGLAEPYTGKGSKPDWCD